MSSFEYGDMTNLMYLKATSQTLSLSEAVGLMKEETFLRPVRETLAKACGMEGCGTDELERYLKEILHESDPSLSGENIRKNVRLWLGDRKYSIKRAWALRLALVFGLQIDEAEVFLARTCQETFHWRDPRDIAYIYAVLQGMTPAETAELLKELEADPEHLLKVQKTEQMQEVYTEQIAESIWGITSVGELKEFLRANRSRLGSFHNTAYRLFMEYLETLGWKKRATKQETEEKTEQEKDDGDETLTTRELLEKCLFGKLVPRIKRADKDGEDGSDRVLTELQNELRRGLPEETELSRMINRHQDVNRKVMMLLFLATDGETDSGKDIGAQLEEQQDYREMVDSWKIEDIVEDRYERMNTMLNQCGYAGIDPRSRFDWICLYCMGVEEACLMDGRMQRFLSELFEAEVEEKLAGFNDEDEEEDIFRKVWESKFKD